jgi:hypothetical protein
MTAVRLTHRPTRDPEDAQPHRTEFESIAEALAYNYRMSEGRGFPVGTEIRVGDDVKYNSNDLSAVNARIRTLTHGISIDEAAAQVAEADGHS